MDDHTRDLINLIREDVLELKTDVKKLVQFRAWFLGMAVAISAIISFMINHFIK